MRVKVDSTWFSVTPTQPIMVELTEQDKINISSMIPTATKYATFHDDNSLSVEDRLKWME